MPRIVAIRLFVYVYLFLVVVLVPYLVFTTLKDYEEELKFADYDARIENIIAQARDYVAVNNRALEVASKLAGQICNTARSWPNCSMGFNTFAAVTTPLLGIAHIRNVRLSPIVSQDQLAGFQSFILNTWNISGEPDWGTTEAGTGVWARRENRSQYVQTHTDLFPSGANPIFTPVTHTDSSTSILLYNMYSDDVKVKLMDAIIAGGCDGQTFSSSNGGMCGGISETKISRGGTPLMFAGFPVFPSESPSELVGFLIAPLHVS